MFTDAFNPFSYYFSIFDNSKDVDFPELPLWHTWMPFFEYYHNHLYRFRGREKVVVLEIGVQSGGKIPLLRYYLGPGMEYIGIDINSLVRDTFDQSADWVHIEIGSSEESSFLQRIKEKYPKIDIVLDDGGHTMSQQINALKELLPHIAADGVYMCEDLSTSWAMGFGGAPWKDVRNPEFVSKTMVGKVHQTIDMLHSTFIPGQIPPDVKDIPPDYFDDPLSDVIRTQVKHIHIYNQVVVYEKGLYTEIVDRKTVGTQIPYTYDARVQTSKVDMERIMEKIHNTIRSPWRR